MLGRSKAPLALMEQILMVLFFAMAAAVVLRAFAWCGTQSRRLVQEDACLSAASSVCEAVRAGDLGLIGMDGAPDGDFDIELDGCQVSARYEKISEYLWIAQVTASSGGVSITLETAGQL